MLAIDNWLWVRGYNLNIFYRPFVLLTKAAKDAKIENSHPACGRREEILTVTCPVKFTIVRSDSGFNRGLLH